MARSTEVVNRSERGFFTFFDRVVVTHLLNWYDKSEIKDGIYSAEMAKEYEMFLRGSCNGDFV